MKKTNVEQAEQIVGSDSLETWQCSAHCMCGCVCVRESVCVYVCLLFSFISISEGTISLLCFLNEYQTTSWHLSNCFNKKQNTLIVDLYVYSFLINCVNNIIMQ